MKKFKFKKLKSVIKQAHQYHLEASTTKVIILFGLFITCALLIRLVRNYSPNIVKNDESMHILISPVVDDGLSEQESWQIAELISTAVNIKVTPELEGIRLNDVYGHMGREQHLPRYPGDHMGLINWFQREGMTPGVGAFGYFANSKQALTPELAQMEKYYIAVQTLYLPTWNSDWVRLKPWFRFRKMLVVNPSNGKMVVAVVGDAGPAQWTGKQFGGSPEVYHELNLKDRKNEVIVLFIDEQPGQEIPIGPVSY